MWKLKHTNKIICVPSFTLSAEVTFCTPLDLDYVQKKAIYSVTVAVQLWLLS